jgi:hypothetical protein
MGGGGEDDDAATLFAEGAQGGDILILRATGSTSSYPNYFLTTLSPSPRPSSAVTIRTDTPSMAGDSGVLCRVAMAEAIWLAGGDQWDYLGGWPQEVHTALANHTAGGGVVGGTSAGAVSLGEAAFDARLGTVTSAEALGDPLRGEVSLSYPSFFQPELQGVLVDSHFTERGREGRLLAFLARFLVDKERTGVVGIGLDEGVALVIRGLGFQAFGPEGGAAWAYRVRGPAVLLGGEPLSLEGISRVRLDVGTTGEWPLDFDLLSGVALRVEEGVVTLGPPTEDGNPLHP